MFTSNPFADLTRLLPAIFMQIYVALMLFIVPAGTLLETRHKGSARFFAQRRKVTSKAAKRELSSTETASLVTKTAIEAAVSGEFRKWPRRLSHLLMLYGILLYIVTTAVMVFVYPRTTHAPVILPILWDLGAFLILVGGLWFFLFLRVNVVYDGDPPLHVGRADLFIISLLGSAAFALLWHGISTTHNTAADLTLFGIYLFFTTVLFGSVFWSKFAHMFYKPVVAFQRRVDEARGSSALPNAQPISRPKVT